MEGLTYTQAANHLMATVSEIPEYHMMHKASSAGSTQIHGGGGGTAHTSSWARKLMHRKMASTCQMAPFLLVSARTGKN